VVAYDFTNNIDSDFGGLRIISDVFPSMFDWGGRSIKPIVSYTYRVTK
jgi:hypothetical protein